MINWFFTTSNAPLFVLLAMNIPWIIIFVYVIYKKFNIKKETKNKNKKQFIKTEILWISIVLMLFISINLISISSMPKAEATQNQNETGEIQNINVTAQMWNYQISNRNIKTNTQVKFKARSLDTVHSFSVYNPEGNIIFTKMLIPNTKQEFVYTFKEPGRYTIRCLEYCGRGHGYMKDYLLVQK